MENTENTVDFESARLAREIADLFNLGLVEFSMFADDDRTVSLGENAERTLDHALGISCDFVASGSDRCFVSVVYWGTGVLWSPELIPVPLCGRCEPALSRTWGGAVSPTVFGPIAILPGGQS